MKWLKETLMLKKNVEEILILPCHLFPVVLTERSRLVIIVIDHFDLVV